MSAIRIVTGKEGIPLMIREGLFVEIVQRLIGGGEFSWEVTLDQIGEEALMKLKESGRLERIHAKVKEIMQQLTENLNSLFFDPIGDS
jgi:hypothetical protein